VRVMARAGVAPEQVQTGGRAVVYPDPDPPITRTPTSRSTRATA